MRSPGNDFDLALGWLWSEGLITASADVLEMRYCTGDGSRNMPAAGTPPRNPHLDHPSDTAEPADPAGNAAPGELDMAQGRFGAFSPSDESDSRFNMVNITPRPGTRLHAVANAGHHSAMHMTSGHLASGACGICSKSAIDELVDTRTTPPSPRRPRLRSAAIFAAVDRLGQPRQLFAATGGTHSAAIADLDGNLMVVRDDTGRHNALDKAIGWAVRNGQMPLHDKMLVVSSRAGFELAQKTAMSGAAALVALSATSSSAIDAAIAADFSLIAFASNQRFVLYAGAERLVDQ
jgi:FdhD protein